MKKHEREIAWKVANGTMIPAEAARKLKVHPNNVHRTLFQGLVEVLKRRNILK